MLMHVLAAAEPASITAIRADFTNILGAVGASQLRLQGVFEAQSLRLGSTACTFDSERVSGGGQGTDDG